MFLSVAYIENRRLRCCTIPDFQQQYFKIDLFALLKEFGEKYGENIVRKFSYLKLETLPVLRICTISAFLLI